MFEFFKNFPTLDLDIVNLREIKLSDAENFYKYISHPEVKKFLADEDSPTDIESAKKDLLYWYNLYRTYSSVFWAITNSDDKMIGSCGFNIWNIYHKRAEISFDLAVEYWGKGIMTRIVQNLTAFAFERMKVVRIQATVSVDNISSQRVLEKCGYVKEGILHKYGILQGISRDFYMFSIQQ